MTGAETAGELPPPVSYTVEPQDLAAVRARQLGVMRRDMAPVLSNVLPLLVGAVYAGCVYLAFRSLIPRPIPGLALLVVALCVFGVSIGGLAQWGIARWGVGRVLTRLDRRVAASAGGGEATATLDHDGLTTASKAGVSTRCAYAAMASVENDETGLFVKIGQDLILHVPRRAFDSDEALTAWAAAIESRRTAAAPLKSQSLIAEH